MTTDTTKNLSKGQLAYEQERARKAGKSLEEWLKAKERAKEEEAKKAAPKAEIKKKKGFFSRLIEKAHEPL